MQIDGHFTWKKIFIYTLPPILMMIFTSLYGIVDGFFVSNFVGETEYSSVNFVMPVIMILASIGFMIGSGGSALISKTLGEGKKEKANQIFSLLVYISLICGVVLGILAIILLKPLVILLGAKGDMIEKSVLYGRILLFVLPLYILQYEFQTLIITSQKQTLGLIITLISGCTNIILDALFIVVFKWGIIGAAVASAIAQSLGGIIPLIYFSRKNSSLLKLGKTNLDFKALRQACLNGSSEFISNVAMSILSIVFNYQLMKFYGEFGVAAYGTYMYVGLIFYAIFIGYISGMAPIIGYNYGAKCEDEIKSIFKKSLFVIAISSILMTILGILLARPLSLIFVSYNEELLNLTIHVLSIASISFLFSGISVFSSGFFTSLNDGVTSACISFGRTFLFQIGLVLILPLFLKESGIWYSIIISEICAAIVSIFFLIIKKKKYNY